MEQYAIRPYNRGGWVIVANETDDEVIVFNGQGETEKTCQFLNEQKE